MKKFIITSLSMLFITFNSFSQVSVVADLGFLSSDGESDLGISIEGKYDLNDDMRLGIATGWYGELEDGYSFGIIPLSAAFEYRLLDGPLRPYAGLNAGLYAFRIAGGGESYSESYLGFAPVFGADYEISDNVGINVNAKYHYITNEGESTSAIALNFGVCFAF